MSLSGFHLSVDSPPGPVRPPTPKRATAFDCSYPLEAVNMQPEYKAEYKPEFRPNKEVREYESVYYPAAASTNLQPWQYSPIFSTTNPPAYYSGDGYYPAVPPPPIDPWGGYHRQVQGPSTPLRSYSFERLNQPTGYGAASGGCPSSAYCVRSPNPSPVHTPSNSPVLNRSRFTPSPGSSPSLSRNPGTSRRINAVALPLPVKGGGAASKPPRPRPAAHRPPLHKSKTIDHSYLPPPLTLMHPPLDAGSKIPSLDSLYEQLKAFAASPEANAKGRAARVDAHLAADLAALVGDVTRARSASYSGASLSVRNQYHQVFLTAPLFSLVIFPRYFPSLFSPKLKSEERKKTLKKYFNLWTCRTRRRRWHAPGFLFSKKFSIGNWSVVCEWMPLAQRLHASDVFSVLPAALACFSLSIKLTRRRRRRSLFFQSKSTNASAHFNALIPIALLGHYHLQTSCFIIAEHYSISIIQLNIVQSVMLYDCTRVY